MKYKCPHCKKVLDLSEVIEKQAQNLADQEVDKKLKIREGAMKKAALLEVEKEFQKQSKEQNIKTQQLREENKKLLQTKETDKKKAAEAAKVLAKVEEQKKLYQQSKKHEQEREQWKIEKARIVKDADKFKKRANQGLTTDQGIAQEITMGNFLEEIFKNFDDEIIAYGKGESGGDRLQKIKNDGIEVGRILYESKETESFSNKWIGKLQDDMKEVKANVGVIFTAALPKDFDKKLGYKQINNIFICKYSFDALQFLAFTQRKMLEILYEKNQGKKEDNKISAEEFFESATAQNIFGLILTHFMNLGQNIDKSIKSLNNAKQNYLDVDKFLDDLFKITTPLGLKKKK